MTAKPEQFQFMIRINDGPEQAYTSVHSIYSLAVMEAFGRLGMPYPCNVEIWCPGLPEEGYGPYRYRVDDFVDMRRNRYGCPSVMSAGVGRAALEPPHE